MGAELNVAAATGLLHAAALAGCCRLTHATAASSDRRTAHSSTIPRHSCGVRTWRVTRQKGRGRQSYPWGGGWRRTGRRRLIISRRGYRNGSPFGTVLPQHQRYAQQAQQCHQAFGAHPVGVALQAGEGLLGHAQATCGFGLCQAGGLAKTLQQHGELFGNLDAEVLRKGVIRHVQAIGCILMIHSIACICVIQVMGCIFQPCRPALARPSSPTRTRASSTCSGWRSWRWAMRLTWLRQE